MTQRVKPEHIGQQHPALGILLGGVEYPDQPGSALFLPSIKPEPKKPAKGEGVAENV